MLLDLDSVVVSDTLRLLDTATGADLGPLRTLPGHPIDVPHLAYHRGLFPLDW